METAALCGLANGGQCPELRAPRAPKQHLLPGMAGVDDTPGRVPGGEGNVGWSHSRLGAFTVNDTGDSFFKLLRGVESSIRRSCHDDFLTPKYP